MLPIFLLAFTGIVLGISMAAPPGPVMSIIMNRSLNSVRSGFLVGMGAMTADLILLGLVYELNATVNFSMVEPFIFLIGGIFFVYLAYMIYHKRNDTDTELTNEAGKNSYLRGLAIGIVNPMQIGWWITAGLGILRTEGITPYYFFYLGIIVYVFLFSLLINRTFIKFGSLMKTGISLFSILVLLGFAIYFIYAFFLSFL